MQTENDNQALLRLLNSMQPGDIEKLVDEGVRHKNGATPKDFLKSFLTYSRLFGYATYDDSWNEFEKEFTIMVRRIIVAERNLKKANMALSKFGHPPIIDD